MKNFIYEKMPKVYFGQGILKQILQNELNKVGKNVIEFDGIMSNPTYNKVQEGAKLARENDVDFILAVGGGSVLDCCKMISAQAKTDEESRYFPQILESGSEYKNQITIWHLLTHTTGLEASDTANWNKKNIYLNHLILTV